MTTKNPDVSRAKLVSRPAALDRLLDVSLRNGVDVPKPREVEKKKAVKKESAEKPVKTESKPDEEGKKEKAAEQK